MLADSPNLITGDFRANLGTSRGLFADPGVREILGVENAPISMEIGNLPHVSRDEAK